MQGTVPSTGDMQGKEERNPCPHGADILMGERDNKYLVSFKVVSATGNKQQVRGIRSTWKERL